MKTSVLLKQNLLKSFLFVLISASAIVAEGQPSTGLQADNASAVTAATRSTVPTGNKLASFAAILNDNKVELKWTTEIETNLSHIMVEKSTDGKNFKDAALVFTYGNTTARSDYAFADNISKIKTGSVYYRLRIVDGDGTTQYSDIRIINISK